MLAWEQSTGGAWGDCKVTLREEHKGALLTRRVLQARIVPGTWRCDYCDLTQIVYWEKVEGYQCQQCTVWAQGQGTEPSAWSLASRVSGVPGIERQLCEPLKPL